MIHWTHQIEVDRCRSCDERGDGLFLACSRPLLVLSLWQPWATLVVVPDPAKDLRAAPKSNETRHWKPRLELPYTVVVHAAKRYDAQTRGAYVRWPFADALRRCGYHAGDPRKFKTIDFGNGVMRRAVPLGALVGTVEIYDVVDTQAWLREEGAKPRAGESFAEEQQFGDYAPGRFAWKLRNPIAFREPIAFSGRQDALYAVEQETRRRIDEQVAIAKQLFTMKVVEVRA